jgi:hypothetical protein
MRCASPGCRRPAAAELDVTWPVDGFPVETRLLCFACLYHYGGQGGRARPLDPGQAETILCDLGKDHEADAFVFERPNQMALWVCWEHLRRVGGPVHYVRGHRCSNLEEVDELVRQLSPYGDKRIL